MSKQDEIVQTISVLRKEVEVLTLRLKPHGTGHLHTTIDTLNSRIDELIGEAITPYFDNPDNNLSPRKLAGKIFDTTADEDVYDGYDESDYTDGFSICYQSAANNSGLNERFKKEKV